VRQPPKTTAKAPQPDSRSCSGHSPREHVSSPQAHLAAPVRLVPRLVPGPIRQQPFGRTRYVPLIVVAVVAGDAAAALPPVEPRGGGAARIEMRPAQPPPACAGRSATPTAATARDRTPSGAPELPRRERGGRGGDPLSAAAVNHAPSWRVTPMPLGGCGGLASGEGLGRDTGANRPQASGELTLCSTIPAIRRVYRAFN
jgi:hypothetical protein